MTRHSREEMALRREALATRASLQRIEIAAALGRMREGSVASKSAGALMLRLARSALAARPAGSPGAGGRPLLLSAGWIALRVLRASPTARWIAGAAAVGAAVWWVARSLREDEGDRAAEAPREPAPGADESG